MKKTSKKLALHMETLKPLVLQQATGAGARLDACSCANSGCINHVTNTCPDTQLLDPSEIACDSHVVCTTI